MSMSGIRDALSQLDPTSTAHQASKEPSAEEIYTPSSHATALDWSRALVVGNRGVGKSFWASVLAHESSRAVVATSFPRLRLGDLSVVLGFHEDAATRDGVAPSPNMLQTMLDQGHTAEAIWRAVLLRAAGEAIGQETPGDVLACAKSVTDDPLGYERTMRTIDAAFVARRQRFLLVFDALDRLGSSWETIRRMSEGILRLALEMRGYHALRAKVFMRNDQASDRAIFNFPDSSKLKAERVDLQWPRRDLYGLVFRMLWRAAPNDMGAAAASAGIVVPAASPEMPEQLRIVEEAQIRLFDVIAGEYMGSNARRGRTYTWLHGHLADAFEETSPRSFLIALKTAAARNPHPAATAIDHLGLQDGVRAASETRVDQLQEDYDWIKVALTPLEGMEVPCDPAMFIQRWLDERTITAVESNLQSTKKLGPVELENSTPDKESALLQALVTIGVIEWRAKDRINMPDLFRVQARIKRRGGVKPPMRPR